MRKKKILRNLWSWKFFSFFVFEFHFKKYFIQNFQSVSPENLKSINMTTYYNNYPKELQEELKRIANAIVAPGKGILAADESTATCGKRFAVSFF